MSLWSSSSNWFSIRKYQGWYIIDPACASRGHHIIDSSLKIIRFDIHPACDCRANDLTNSLLNIIKFGIDPACASKVDYLIESSLKRDQV